jgi:hypothetical protein
MTTRLLRAIPLAPCAAVVLLGWFTGLAVAAGPPQKGTGTGTITSFEITSSRDAGPNRIQERRLEGTLDGTFQGTFVELVSGVIHPNGLVTFQGTLEFTGTIDGCGAGALTGALSGQGQSGLPVTEAALRVIDQPSNTLHVTGKGTVRQVGRDMTYEVQYVCR